MKMNKKKEFIANKILTIFNLVNIKYFNKFKLIYN